MQQRLLSQAMPSLFVAVPQLPRLPNGRLAMFSGHPQLDPELELGVCSAGLSQVVLVSRSRVQGLRSALSR